MLNKLFRRKNLEEARRAHQMAQRKIRASEQVRQEEIKWRERNNFAPLITQAIRKSS